jgi:hypothetical protein
MTPDLMPPPAILTVAAAALAQHDPTLYTGSLLERIEWVGRVAEQLAYWRVAYWGESVGAWGTIYGAPIVACWHGGVRYGWAFAHRADRPVVPVPVEDVSGIFVDVPHGVDWLRAWPPVLAAGDIQSLRSGGDVCH